MKRGSAAPHRRGRSHPAKKMPWRTVILNMSLNDKQALSQMHFESAPIRTEVRKLAKLFHWFQLTSKLLLAYAAA